MCKRTEIIQGKKKKIYTLQNIIKKCQYVHLTKKKSLSYEFPIYILEKNEGGGYWLHELGGFIAFKN